MNTSATPLPEDTASLKQLVAQQHAELIHKQTRIEQLEHKLRLLQHQRFGQSSEHHRDQTTLQLFNEAELLDDHAPDLSDDDYIDVPPHKRRRKSFKDNLKDKPRVEIVYDLTDEQKQCDACGETMSAIGQESSEQLAVLPQPFFVIEHIKLKYACACKGCIKTASMPAQPLPGSQASPLLLAYIATAKYLDGLPLHRLEKIAAREGIDLPRNKLARWLIQLTKVLQPVYNLLQDTLFSYDITLSDDTGIQVLKEDGRRAENKSYLWIRRGGPPDKPVVLVDYAPSKSGETAYGLLSQCHGFLVSDAASNFNKSVEKNHLTHVLCNDHARRKFHDVIKGLKKRDNKSNKTSNDKTKVWIATKALAYYKELYRLEKRIANESDEKKKSIRQDKAVPIWKAFMRWARQIQQQGVTNEGTREALNYLITHEKGLREYCNDGRLPISNIKSEHVAKTIAISRKNFLFADTPAGADSSAMLFSMLESAKANHHNPHHYLTVLLTDLPNAQSVDDIEVLLPWNLTPEAASLRYHALPKP